MIHIIILTNSFPFFPGEQFLEEEIKYWEKSERVKITILPRERSGEARKTPTHLSTHYHLLPNSRFEKYFWAIRSFFSKIFLLELRYLAANKKTSIKTISQALRTTLNTLLLAHKIQRYVRDHGKIDLIYGYWNEVSTYAACLVKRAGSASRVVSRAHGHDLYEYRRPSQYMPLKRQFIKDIDTIYFLSEEGINYFKNTYNPPSIRLTTSPLGVQIPRNQLLEKQTHKEVHFVSVSYCTPIKRIDKIIKAVRIFALRNSNMMVRWTHIGSGPLFEKLREEAEHSCSSHSNLEINFLGELSNAKVKKFYVSNFIDIFINASESEGMPVSIMEAMASGVPAIAPDIGGISNLIKSTTGILMSKNPTCQEISDTLEKLIFAQNHRELRINSRELIRSKFNAQHNYSNFVSDLYEIAMKDNDCVKPPTKTNNSAQDIQG